MELKEKKRVIRENGTFLAAAPYFSTAPYQVSVYQKGGFSRYEDISDEGISDLSDIFSFASSTAMVAAVPDPSLFRSARHFASWRGLTPRESSSGQRRRLGRISKRGNTYLRTLM